MSTLACTTRRCYYLSHLYPSDLDSCKEANNELKNIIEHKAPPPKKKPVKKVVSEEY